MLQSRINALSPYFKSMEITNGTLIVRVQFEDKWGVYPSQDERVKVAKSEEVHNEWFYYCDYEIVPINEVFDLIEETITMNRSAERKLEMLAERFEELKTLFATESLERLQTLKFVLDDEKPIKVKKKTSKKKREETLVEMESQVVAETNEGVTVTA